MLRRISLIWLHLSLRSSDPGSQPVRRDWSAASDAALVHRSPCCSYCCRFGVAAGRNGVPAGGWSQSAAVRDCRILVHSSLPTVSDLSLC